MIFGPIFTSFLDGVVSDQRFTYFAEPMSASGHKQTYSGPFLDVCFQG